MIPHCLLAIWIHPTLQRIMLISVNIDGFKYEYETMSLAASPLSVSLLHVSVRLRTQVVHCVSPSEGEGGSSQTMMKPSCPEKIVSQIQGHDVSAWHFYQQALCTSKMLSEP